jgi:hypothetical protein
MGAVVRALFRKGQVKAERGVFFDEKCPSVNNYFKAGGRCVIL